MWSKDMVERPTEWVSGLSYSQSSRLGRTIYPQHRTCIRRHLGECQDSLPGCFSLGQPGHRAVVCLYRYGDFSQLEQPLEDPAVADNTDIEEDAGTFIGSDREE